MTMADALDAPRVDAATSRGSQCSVCGHADVAVVDNGLYDDRYGYPGRFDLVECPTCGHRNLAAQFSPQQLTDLYTQFYPRSALRLEDHKPRTAAAGFHAWLDGTRASAYRWVPRDVRVLDIGCGFGETLGYHKARGCEVYGVEADENIRRVAERFGYNVHVGLFDPAVYEPKMFDWVTLDQVLEHTQEPTTVLRGVASVLKDDGRVVVSVPNAGGWGARVFGRNWINWHAPYHLNFFSRRSMRRAAEQCGLVIEKTVTVTPSAWLFYQLIHSMSRPAEGTQSTFWSHAHRFTEAQRRRLRVIEALERRKVTHWITRVFDFLQLGDSRLYILRKS